MEGKDNGWSKDLLYRLVDSVRDYAIFVTEPSGSVVSWNVGAEHIFGYPAEDALGMDSRLLFTPEDRAERIPETEMETALAKGCAEDERWHLRKDGTRFFASGVQTPLFDRAGVHRGFAKIARDLTKRVVAEQKLQEAYDSVEAKVRDRTAELFGVNEELTSQIEIREQLEQTRTALLRRIIRTQEDERRRIARDIHDQIGQAMTAMQLRLRSMIELHGGDPVTLAGLEQLQTEAKRVDAEIDFLAWELRPSVLDDLGLTAAIEKYVADWSSHFGVPARFKSLGKNGLHFPPETEINLYRIVQEALNNVAKHAKASMVSVLIEQVDGRVSIIIEDDGVGFNPAEKANVTSDDRGMGLIGMRERAELVGGTLNIESGAGLGTTVFVRVPVQPVKARGLDAAI